METLVTYAIGYLMVLALAATTIVGILIGWHVMSWVDDQIAKWRGR